MSTDPGTWAPRSTLRRGQHGQQSSVGLAAGGAPPDEPIADPATLRLAQIDVTLNGAKTLLVLKRPGSTGGLWTAAELAQN